MSFRRKTYPEVAESLLNRLLGGVSAEAHPYPPPNAGREPFTHALERAPVAQITAVWGERNGGSLSITGARPEQTILLDEVAEKALENPAEQAQPTFVDFLADIGRSVVFAWRDLVKGTEFLGSIVVAVGRVALSPKRYRPAALTQQIEHIALRGVPIITLISFLVGAIVAQQGGRIVGLLLGFVFGSTFSYFQNGWEPELRNLSIGTVLVDLAVEYAVELGCTTFDFLRGTTDYKYRFGGEDSIDETWLLPRGLGGRLLAWKYTSGRDVARRGVLTPGPA